jgi:hypothetical protein
MIVLDAITKSLEVKLAGAPAADQLVFLSSWEDITATAFTPGETDGLTNGGTAVKLVPVPGDGTTQRRIKAFTIYNNDTAPATVTIQYNNNGTLRILKVAILQIKETLSYALGEWKVFDATGAQKLAQSGSGRWLKTTVLTAGTTFLTGPQTTSLFLRMVGGGGGGGGGLGCARGRERDRWLHHRGRVRIGAQHG